jgi:hypothetical protein
VARSLRTPKLTHTRVDRGCCGALLPSATSPAISPLGWPRRPQALGVPVPVAAGFAFRSTSTMTKGTHTLSAVFIPTNPTMFGPSTSPPVSLMVFPRTVP